MPADILVREMNGTPKQIVFRASTFSPTAANDLRDATSGNRTEAQITLASLANTNGTSTGGRQSNKVDLGANRAEWYRVRAALEFAATPTAGNSVDLWWFPSSSSTAGTGNSGAVTGSDAAYSGYSSNLNVSVVQGRLIGIFTCTTQITGTIQVAECGMFSPTERYGTLVIINRSGASLHSDSDEHHIVFDPIVSQIQ